MFETAEQAQAYAISKGFSSFNSKVVENEKLGGYTLVITAGLWKGAEFYNFTITKNPDIITNSGGGGGSKGGVTKEKKFGINFTTTTGGSKGLVKPEKGDRYTFTILADIIMFYVDIFGPKTKVGVDRDAINALNNQKNERKETYEYKTWTTLSTDMQPEGQNYLRLKETNRRIEMTPTEYKNTNWDAKKMIDSIQAVEQIKAHEKSRGKFEKSLNK